MANGSQLNELLKMRIDWVKDEVPPWLFTLVDKSVLRDLAIVSLERSRAVQHAVREVLRFHLQRWSVSAGDGPPTFIPVAEGTLQNLKDLAEPGPGIYRLSFDMVRPHSEDVQTCNAWLLFTDWDVSLYTSAAYEDSPQAYHAMLARKPAENRRLDNLAFPDNEPNSVPGPGGQTEYFALAASTALDLPAGRYRFSATSDEHFSHAVEVPSCGEVSDVRIVHGPD